MYFVLLVCPVEFSLVMQISVAVCFVVIKLCVTSVEHSQFRLFVQWCIYMFLRVYNCLLYIEELMASLDMWLQVFV